MKGIYIINERLCINNLSKEESFKIQEQSIINYIQEKNIQIMKLNPNQLHDFYTIPHALLYDLKQNKNQIDCLLMHSIEVVEDFIYTYPARWLILKSFFVDIIVVDEASKQKLQSVI